ncbi:MAG: zinc-ribbon domain-containing protein, partial [Planctomycetales bacterium]|nr:zinc-ribbon domain-containing protein [Planctomycetales bacterium]
MFTDDADEWDDDVYDDDTCDDDYDEAYDVDAYDDDVVETVACPSCGAEIYEDAERCPHCGD